RPRIRKQQCAATQGMRKAHDVGRRCYRGSQVERFDPARVGWRRVVEQNLGFVRLNREPFTVGSATAIFPNESHGINPRSGDVDLEGGVGCTPPAVEASQSEALESVFGILSRRNPETVITVDAHGVKLS